LDRNPGFSGLLLLLMLLLRYYLVNNIYVFNDRKTEIVRV